MVCFVVRFIIIVGYVGIYDRYRRMMMSVLLQITLAVSSTTAATFSSSDCFVIATTFIVHLFFGNDAGTGTGSGSGSSA